MIQSQLRNGKLVFASPLPSAGRSVGAVLSTTDPVVTMMLVFLNALRFRQKPFPYGNSELDAAVAAAVANVINDPLNQKYSDNPSADVAAAEAAVRQQWWAAADAKYGAAYKNITAAANAAAQWWKLQGNPGKPATLSDAAPFLEQASLWLKSAWKDDAGAARFVDWSLVFPSGMIYNAKKYAIDAGDAAKIMSVTTLPKGKFGITPKPDPTGKPGWTPKKQSPPGATSPVLLTPFQQLPGNGIVQHGGGLTHHHITEDPGASSPAAAPSDSGSPASSSAPAAASQDGGSSSPQSGAPEPSGGHETGPVPPVDALAIAAKTAAVAAAKADASRKTAYLVTALGALGALLGGIVAFELFRKELGQHAGAIGSTLGGATVGLATLAARANADAEAVATAEKKS